MSIILSNAIVRPLHKSINLAKSISKGNLTTQITDSFNDEKCGNQYKYTELIAQGVTTSTQQISASIQE